MPVKKFLQRATTASTITLFGLLQKQLLLSLGCILAALVAAGPAWGQAVDLGHITPSETADQYLAAIEKIEADYGSYATELSDMYMGLGQTLLNSGDYEQSRDAFHRGVMVLRVNSGPNSPEQTNQLYMLANIETLLGNDEEADDILHNVYFINSDYYGENSPEMLPVLERIYNWYQQRRPLGSTLSQYRDYNRNIDLTEEMADVSEAVLGESHPDTGLAYKRYAEAEFQMVRHLTGLGMTMTREDYTLATSGTLVPLGLGEESVDEHNDKGRKAFKKYLAVLEADPATTPLEYAQALADLGDWYMVFDRSRKARNLYEEAYSVLAQSDGYAEQAKGFMNQPAPMHFIPKPEPGFLDKAPVPVKEINLEISMTVTTQGSVRNIEILNAPEDMLEDDLWQIKKQVQETPFRPAMANGEVVTTEGYLWNYLIVIYGEAS
jgi:tetratricopeptide (TPR) repeat protein